MVNNSDMKVCKTVTKNSAPLIVTLDKVSKEALFEKAADNGSTVSQMMRDLIHCILTGNTKPVLRVQILHPLEPGTYGFVSLNEEEENVRKE